MSDGERRLIVNADDLGLHARIDAGILRSHRDGIVTSASISPNGASFVEAAAAARASGLPVGIHLTLVGEAPVSAPEAVPSLAPAGRLPPGYRDLFRRLLLGRVRRPELERELEAQVARARDAGLEITHLDSHQHVHLHPALLPLTLALARRFGIPAVRAAPWVWPVDGIRTLTVALLMRRAAGCARREGLRVPDMAMGIAETGGLREERLVQILEHLSAGTSVLVCHPGSADAEIDAAYGWHFHWDDETRALTSPAVREILRRRTIQLIDYRDI